MSGIFIQTTKEASGMKTALPHFNTMGGKKEWFFHVLKCGKAFMSHLTLHFYCPNDGGNYSIENIAWVTHLRKSGNS